MGVFRCGREILECFKMAVWQGFRRTRKIASGLIESGKSAVLQGKVCGFFVVLFSTARAFLQFLQLALAAHEAGIEAASDGGVGGALDDGASVGK